MLYDPHGEISGTPTSIYLESAVAHEVAHQWFYNVVGNDQVDEPWVDEALVQYLTGLYYRDVYGEEGYEGFKESWNSRWGRVDFEDIPIGFPVEGYDGIAYGAIVYGRGPLFMDALAEKMGQETFNVFLRDYYETNKWGIGTASEFEELAERHCDCDLSDIFEEWVY
jgi:aminopeptidase N